ncbi:MAG: hypothetical protein ACOCR6_02525 [archaeon]
MVETVIRDEIACFLQLRLQRIRLTSVQVRFDRLEVDLRDGSQHAMLSIRVIIFITPADQPLDMPTSDPIQFRAQEVGAAVDLLKQMRLEGINVSEIGREGMKRVIREITTGDEKARVFSAYQRGEIDEDTARVFLGDALGTMEADAREIRRAVEDDTSDLVQ